MAMALERMPQQKLFRVIVLMAAVASSCAGLAFSCGGRFTTSSPRPLRHQIYQSKPDSVHQWSMGTLSVSMGLASGLIVASRTRRQAQQAAAEDLSGPPSLIQVLERKKLLSLAEKLKLLSAAENAGLTVGTVEQSGLLTAAEQGGLLTKAEAFLTSRSTPSLLLAVALFSGVLYWLTVTGELASLLTGLPADPELGLAEYILAAVFGLAWAASALAGSAIVSLFGGVRRSKPLDSAEVVFDPNAQTFVSSGDATLLKTVENKKLLSFAQKNRLLSLLGKFVDKPLTLVEQQGILSKLESAGLLSSLESQSGKGFGLLSGVGLTLATVAIIAGIFAPQFGLAAAAGGLVGLLLIVTGGVLQTLLGPSNF